MLASIGPAILGAIGPFRKFRFAEFAKLPKIRDLAKLMSNILGKKISLKKTKILKGSPSVRCPNISKIKKLGFKQNISLKDGLKKII